MTHPKWLQDIKDREKAATPKRLKKKSIRCSECAYTHCGLQHEVTLLQKEIDQFRQDIPLLVSKLEVAIEALESQVCDCKFKYCHGTNYKSEVCISCEALRTILGEE